VEIEGVIAQRAVDPGGVTAGTIGQERSTVKRYFELFFRHPVLFSLPMIVALVAGVGYASRAPHTYVAGATVFADTSLPNASTLTAGVSPGFTTPAADKQATLLEFLHTQSFLNKVAARIPLVPLNDNTAAAMGKTIKVSVSGAQILAVTSKSGSPQLAAATVKSVIDEFTAELGSVIASRNQSAATLYKTQLDAANAGLTKAQAALSGAARANPAPSASDMAVLTNQLAAAQAQRDTAQSAYNQALLGISGTVDASTFHIVDPPKVPTAPQPRKKALIMSGIGGLLGGLVITIFALILIMSQDRSVREESDVEGTLDLEVIGTVPQFDKSALSPSSRRRSAEAEGWFWTPPGLVESCTAALQRLDREEMAPVSLPRGGLRVSRRTPVVARGATASTTRTIGVTSCLRGEGRTTVSMGMAVAAYQTYEVKTVLVEFDFERPSLARRLGIEPGPGVAEILRDGATIEECIHMPEDDSVAAIFAGDAHGDTAGLFSSLRRSTLLRDLGGLFEVVVGDLPPLSPEGQTAPLAPLFDKVLLVVRTGTAPVGAIRRALDDLDRPPPVILNGVETSIPRPLRSLLAG
jgi:Mrp family chromosome partitioning ATPase/uncharacterized protein involved in exopolysaccharide biosynthesis